MGKLAENGASSSASSDFGAGIEFPDSGAGTENFGAGTENSFTEVTPSGTGSRKGANG